MNCREPLAFTRTSEHFLFSEFVHSSRLAFKPLNLSVRDPRSLKFGCRPAYALNNTLPSAFVNVLMSKSIRASVTPVMPLGS